MRLSDVYKSMTANARAQAKEDILVLCEQRGIKCSREYIAQVLQGLRVHPCSDDLARVVSGYFVGIIGMNISPADVLANTQV